MFPYKFPLTLVATAVLVSTALQPSHAQSMEAPLAASAATSVPALVPYSGTAFNGDGKPGPGEAAITFLIFKDPSGGEPLFTETQTVAVDASGHYKVQLGASNPNGLPVDLFSTGEARWLEVQIAGQPPQTRVLLASVPYAMKAADSATLGGLPASAFVLAGSKAAAGIAANSSGPALAGAAVSANTVTTTGGASGYVPAFSGVSTIADSPIFVAGTNVGVGTNTPAATLDVNGKAVLRGDVNLARYGNASAIGGVNSHAFQFSPQVWSSTANAAVNPTFSLQAQPIGNNTANPAATLNLLYSNGTTTGETGLYFNPNGTINFAPGQTFPGTGKGTITGVAAGTGLTGGGASGSVTLNLDASKVPLLAATKNAFTGSQSIGGSLSVAGGGTIGANLNVSNAVTAAQVQALTGYFTQGVRTSGVTLPPTGVSSFGGNYGSYPVDFQASVVDYYGGGVAGTANYRLEAETQGAGGESSSSLNLLYGYGDGTNTPAVAETGVSITSGGTINAPRITSPSIIAQQSAGTVNTPALVVQADDDGVSRTAAQQLMIRGASIPDQQLLIGYISDPNTNSNGGVATIQATWTGYENTSLALQPNGGCVCIRTGLNGALSYQADPLVVGQGQGLAIADGWGTYSSRRFKTNIQTLTGALDKVEQLRGVSYTLKATGRREIGVIAEEVGQVVPEVVSYEANGKDARYVDYNRLTALLIEATKQQQSEIALALRQIKVEQAQLRRQAASISALRQQVRSANINRKVNEETASKAAPAINLVASR